MIEDTRVCGANVGLEAGVEHTDLTPVKVECLDIGIANASPETGLLQRSADRTHGRLRSQSRHT